MAPLVLWAFELAAAGTMTTRSILTEVTALGLTTSQGKRLTPQSFGNMLRNPIYAGRMVAPKMDFVGQGDFAPIVSQALFDRVQVALRGNGKGGARHKDHPDFPLRRFMRCSICDAPLTGSWTRGRSRRYPYYRCPRKGCKGVNVRKDRLEQLFVELLEAVSLRKEVFALLAAIVRDAWQERVRAERESQRHLQARLAELQIRRNRVVDAFVQDRAIDKSTYELQCARIDGDMRDVSDQMAIENRTDLDLDGPPIRL